MAENKDDLISREGIKKIVMGMLEKWADGYCYIEIPTGDAIEEMKSTIDNAPTVKITDYDTGYQDGLEDGLNDIRPTGEWIIDQDGDKNTITLVTCPFCGERHCCKMNFCGNCGADMRGGVENGNTDKDT